MVGFLPTSASGPAPQSKKADASFEGPDSGQTVMMLVRGVCLGGPGCIHLGELVLAGETPGGNG